MYCIFDKDNQEPVWPPYLKSGDTIGVCAPARKVSDEDIRSGIDWLKSRGFKVKEAPNLFGSYNQFSGTDEERAGDLNALIADPEVKAILFARGGYGCMRIVDAVNFEAMLQHPKWIIGFSDITVFLSHIHQRYNLPGIHGPVLYTLSGERFDAMSAEALVRALTGMPIRYSWTSCSHGLSRFGTAEGILTGGNLTLLCTLAGSESDIDTKGKILFLEDLDEYLYHIDRMMMQLKRSGKLSEVKGLIVGGMTDMKDNMIPFGKTAYEIIAAAVQEYNFPVCFDFPAGHITRNMPLITGAFVKLNVAKTCTLEFMEHDNR